MKWKTSLWHLITTDARDLDPEFARHLRESARPGQIAFTLLMRAGNGDPTGIEMRCPNRPLWSVVLPEPVAATDKPAWRVLTFDANGFVGHLVYASPQLAAEGMIQSGYAEIDKGALDRCSQQESWEKGLKHQDLRDRLERGEIDWKSMAQLAEAI
jgi:hypothetical protein